LLDLQEREVPREALFQAFVERQAALDVFALEENLAALLGDFVDAGVRELTAYIESVQATKK